MLPISIMGASSIIRPRPRASYLWKLGFNVNYLANVVRWRWQRMSEKENQHLKNIVNTLAVGGSIPRSSVFFLSPARASMWAHMRSHVPLSQLVAVVGVAENRFLRSVPRLRVRLRRWRYSDLWAVLQLHQPCVGMLRRGRR